VLRGYKPLAAVALSSPPTPVGGSPFGRQNGESSPLVSRGTSWRTICLPGIETPGSRRPKLATGATEAAVAEARLALAAFERLGAAREADAASGLLRQLGAAGRAFPRRYGERTKCETEVLSLVADGLQRADRRAPVHQPPHGRAPRGEHPLEARPPDTCRSGRIRRPRGRRNTRIRIGRATDAQLAGAGDPHRRVAARGPGHPTEGGTR
jgi:hypothetical protein